MLKDVSKLNQDYTEVLTCIHEVNLHFAVMISSETLSQAEPIRQEGYTKKVIF